YLTFTISNDGNVAAALAALRELVDGRDTVVGFGQSLAAHLGRPVPGLTGFPAFAVKDRTLPATPADVWVW
ncbi:peroxidase, partial [Escherichia coli]